MKATPKILKNSFKCYLTDCYFNSHDNLRFDEFGDPVGLCFCLAKNEAEITAEEGYGVPDECPAFYGLWHSDEK